MVHGWHGVYGWRCLLHISICEQCAVCIRKSEPLRKDRACMPLHASVGVLRCAQVLPFTFGGLMLVMSAAFRTAVAFTYPQAASNESLFYPLQVMPEMIQAILMALPLFLMQVGGLG